MTHEAPGHLSGAPGITHPPSLHAALKQDFALIERGIQDFLDRRGGLSAATQSLRESIATLRRHIYIEEEFLFPALRDAGEIGPVFAMSTEHHDLWSTLDQMELQLADGSPEAVQQQTCQILMAEFDRHSSAEDPIVFGHAQDSLTSQEQATLRSFVENSVLPPSWVCREPSY